MFRKIDIPLQFKIFSNPAIWYDGSVKSWAVALIRGEEGPQYEKITAVDAYLFNGQQVSNFPVLQQTPYILGPANQVTVADVNKDGTIEMLVVDLEGRLWNFHPGDVPMNPPSMGNPVHGLLAYPPIPISLERGSIGFVLLSRDFKPRAKSLNSLDVVDSNGNSLFGYPINLPSWPELHKPLLESKFSHLFVLLESGVVEGFDLLKAGRLPGFPVPPDKKIDKTKTNTYRLCLFEPWKALVLSSGTNYLKKISTANGKTSLLTIPEAQCLTGLGNTKENLYVVDEANGQLFCLDHHERIVYKLELNLQSQFRNCYTEVISLSEPNYNFVLILSLLESDPDARVRPLFEQNATPEIRIKIQELANAEAMERFHTLDLNPTQRKEIDYSILMMQRSYLENTLGMEETSRLLSIESQSRIQIVLDRKDKMQLVLDETIKRYTPETGFSLSDMICPVIQHAPADKTIYFIIPLNFAERDDDPAKEYNSLIRIYQINY